MKVLIVNQQEVAEILEMGACIDIMADALATLARGEAVQPLRSIVWLPERVGALAMMPGYLGDIKAMGTKAISVFPGNHGTEFDSHQGVVMLFETEHGRLLAIVDATEVTSIRTAATTAVATRLLARKDAADLAILGSGVQARTHLEAILAVRTIERVRVWSRNRERAERFAELESSAHDIGIDVMADVASAVEGAQVICTTTSSPEPILNGEWLEAGMHINAVGSSVPFARELDTAAMVMSHLYVDRRESTVNEAGDFLLPKKEGALDDDHIVAEIGEILIGEHPGRQSTAEITLFKSLGLAIEDVASAHHIYQVASESGAGTWVELGGSRREF